jgi:outer membrane receptor protein involved in Fe transport
MITVLFTLALLQSPPAAALVNGVVVDSTGASVRGAVVTVTREAVSRSVTTSADGTWSADAPAGAGAVEIRVTALGFSPSAQVVTLPAGAIRFELRPAAIAEAITVSAETVATRLAIDSSVTSLDRTSIATAPSLRLDDQLRSVPGFSLFRRTSSAVANPTTQGVTLRGLSASGASRTLVIADDVPLNDPFGAWVYWDRVPLAALQRVDVLRGASGDVHGNDAIGGVIRLTTRTSRGAEAWLDGGSSGTGRASGYLGLSRGAWTAGGAAERLTTNGYRVVAPEARGPADVPADSRASSGFGWLGGARGTLEGTVRGGYFTEDRGNGTPAQVNATVTRWGGASAHGFVGGGVWEARGDVSATNYRQTFSAVAVAGRATERLTALQWVASSGGGAGLSWLRQAGRGHMLFAVNSRVARADLDEASISLTGVQSAITRTRARQRGDGVVAQGRFDLSRRVSLDAGARADYWRLEKLDGADATNTLGFFSPRAGVSFHMTPERTLRIAWLTGFRTPTMNELYRSFRVGNTNTQANAALEPEKSWGPEVAFTMRHDRWTARAIAYATRLDGAVYNRTLSASQTAIVRERSNGDARTVGSELELEWRAGQGLSLTTAWAINDAVFTSGELQGRRVPQVPRVMGSFGARGALAAFTAGATVRVLGAQFDDDRNDFRLRRGTLVDARAGWRWSRHLELFGAMENAFDREIDTGRTPIRTVGAPRIGRAGAIVRF